MKTTSWSWTGKSALVAVGMTAAANLAFAGKELDDRLKAAQTEYQPKLDAIKAACGCTPEVKTSGYKAPADCNRISYAVESVATAAKKYCSEDKYKKAFCAKVKTLDITYAKTVPASTMRGTALELGSNNLGYSGDKGITKLFDGLAD